MLLEELAQRGPSTPSELAQWSGINRTVVYRSLATLAKRRFVVQTSGRYSLGPALVRIAESFEPSLRSSARAVMQSLMQETRETAVLTIRDGAEAVIVEQVPALEHLVRVQFQLGFRHPLFLGADGKVILAFLDSPDAAKIMDAAPKSHQLEKELEKIRSQRYCITHDELRAGAYGLAAPVRSETGSPIASLSVAVPADRAERLADFADSVLNGADQIAKALGY